MFGLQTFASPTDSSKTGIQSNVRVLFIFSLPCQSRPCHVRLAMWQGGPPASCSSSHYLTSPWSKDASILAVATHHVNIFFFFSSFVCFWFAPTTSHSERRDTCTVHKPRRRISARCGGSTVGDGEAKTPLAGDSLSRETRSIYNWNCKIWRRRTTLNQDFHSRDYDSVQRKNVHNFETRRCVPKFVTNLSRGHERGRTDERSGQRRQTRHKKERIPRRWWISEAKKKWGVHGVSVSPDDRFMWTGYRRGRCGIGRPSPRARNTYTYGARYRETYRLFAGDCTLCSLLSAFCTNRIAFSSPLLTILFMPLIIIQSKTVFCKGNK